MINELVLKIPPRLLEKKRHSGFTLFELMLVVAIVAVLAMIGIPYYQNYRDQMNINKAETDIAAIEGFVQHYWEENRNYPDFLTDAGVNMIDPWGNPYKYFNIETAKGKGMLRKDKSLNPINSDYDLYSMGKDGQSQTPLTAPVSHDDIIRARNGQFVGLASDF
jgi:general secretion pathway protein G